MNTPKKLTKTKAKELKVVKLGAISNKDQKPPNTNNSFSKSPKLEKVPLKLNNPRIKTIVLNQNSTLNTNNSNTSSTQTSPKYHSGRNSPLSNTHNSIESNTSKQTKNISSLNKSPVIRKPLYKTITNSPLNNSKIKTKTNIKLPQTYKTKTTNKNTLESSKIIFKHKSNTIYGNSISPKPSSPTEMHKELKTNGNYIKTEKHNQSLAYTIQKQNHINDSPFVDGNNSNNNKIKKRYINKSKDIRAVTPTPLSKTIKKVKHNTNNTNNTGNTSNTSNNNNKHNKLLNKSYDCNTRGTNVFDSTDNIFEYVNNTIIEPVKNKNKTKMKNRVIQRQEWKYKPNETEYYDDLIPRAENGARYTGKFNKNIINTYNNNNDDPGFDRFSFKNQFMQ